MKKLLFAICLMNLPSVAIAATVTITCDTTDQTVAIRNAIAAAGNNGKVILSGQTCHVSNVITIDKHGLEFECQGSVIFLTSGSSDVFRITGDRNYFHSCEINGNTFGQSAIGIVGAYNRIMNNIVHHMGTHGIDIDGQNTTCAGNYVAFNEVYSNGAIGMGTNHCTQVRFIGNSVHDNALEGITCDNQSHFCVITNNVVTHNSATGGIGTDNSNYIIINGNVSQNNATAGISINNQGGSSDHGVISGNTLLTNDGGIYLHSCTAGKRRDDRGTYVNCMGTYGTVAFLVTGNNIEGDSYTIKIDIDGPGISNANIVIGNSVSGVQPTADYQRNYIINNW